MNKTIFLLLLCSLFPATLFAHPASLPESSLLHVAVHVLQAVSLPVMGALICMVVLLRRKGIASQRP